MYETKSPINNSSIGQSNNNNGGKFVCFLLWFITDNSNIFFLFHCFIVVVVDSTDKEFEDILQQLNALGNTIDQELSQVPGKFSKTSTTTTLNNHQNKLYPSNSINGDSNGIDNQQQQQQQSSDMIMMNTLSTTSPSSSSSTSYPSSNYHPHHPYSIHSFHHHHSHSIHDDDNDSTNQILTVVGMCLFDWIKIFPCKFYFYVFPKKQQKTIIIKIMIHRTWF